VEETKIAVVISEEQGEVARFRHWDIDIAPYRKLLKTGFADTDGKSLSVEDAFKKESHPFRVAIVCAMWLTGFDVPCLSTLYLDKPLQAHTLMQAIARANRVHEGKNNGLIIDYCGILKNLRKALEHRRRRRWGSQSSQAKRRIAPRVSLRDRARLRFPAGEGCPT
jgi:type I restriction enzyme R subunit